MINLDLVNPGKSEIGYDPLDFVHNDMDVIHLARRLIGSTPSTSRTGSVDPYWNDSATSVLAAEIGLVMLTAKDSGKRASFADVIKQHRSLAVNSSLKVISTNIDYWFERAAKKHPGNQAYLTDWLSKTLIDNKYALLAMESGLGKSSWCRTFDEKLCEQSELLKGYDVKIHFLFFR